jgi:hypothetical protein
MNICNESYLSCEWYHVVFAKRIDVNVLDNDQLIVILVEDSAVDQVPNILLVTLGEVKHGLGVSLGCLTKPFSLRILADAFENRADSSGQLLKSLFGLLRCRLLPLSGSGA